jgi:hypothetical protein
MKPQIQRIVPLVIAAVLLVMPYAGGRSGGGTLLWILAIIPLLIALRRAKSGSTLFVLTIIAMSIYLLRAVILVCLVVLYSGSYDAAVGRANLNFAKNSALRGAMGSDYEVLVSVIRRKLDISRSLQRHFLRSGRPEEIRDPFAGRGSLKRADGITYSIGPDGIDNHASFEYDPTNGLQSDGDIIVSMRGESQSREK